MTVSGPSFPQSKAPSTRVLAMYEVPTEITGKVMRANPSTLRRLTTGTPVDHAAAGTYARNALQTPQTRVGVQVNVYV